MELFIYILIFVAILLYACLCPPNRDDRHTNFQVHQLAYHQEPHRIVRTIPSGPPQARVHTTAGHTKRMSERAFHLFIQKVIEIFKGQRKKQQFAVLFLASQKNFTGMEFRTRKGVVSASNPPTNNQCDTHPSHRDLCNFVTARPGGGHHAEELLMGRFNTLMSSYCGQGMAKCQYIILYTWFLPCRECTGRIIQTLASQIPDYKVILVYTTKMEEISVENERDTVSTLKSNRISIRCEDYDKDLCSRKMSEKEFNLFIQKVIEIFKGQRKIQQFAVLASEKNFAMMEFWTRKGVVSASNPAINDNFETYPLQHNLCNYVTARPEVPHHAEALLMGKFDVLMNSYCKQRMPPCRYIVLYSWLLPCEHCTEEILHTLSSQTQHYKVILVYTSKMHDVSDENERDIVNTLKRHGIIVRCEAYDQFLPYLE